MRIAESQLYTNARTYGGAARSRVVEASNRMSSGYRITGPGDDVTAFGLTQRHSVVAQKSAHFARVTSRVNHEVQAADSALTQVADNLIEARTLAVQLANDTYDADGRANAATTVASIRSSITSSLNVELGGRFLFAGTQTQSPPFDATGVYAGDDQARRIEIAPGVFETVALNPEAAFLGTAGGVNIFTALQDLEAALLSDDSAQIRATLDGLTTAISQIASAQSELGGHSNVVTAAQNAHVRMEEQARIAAAEESELDIIYGATELAQAQNALDATLTAAAKTFELSLLDRLR